VFQNFGSLDSTVISFKDYLRSNECDFEQKYGGKSFKKIQETYFPNDNLIILDPTDYNRNVASSISYRTFLFMKKTISSFIKLPSPSYFERNPIEPIGQKNLDKEELGKYFYMEYYVEEDDHYTKFRDKLYSFMSKVTEMAKRERTEEKRFEDPKGELVYDIPSKSYVLSLSTSTPSISPKFIREGPPVNSNYHSKKFLQAHPDAFKKNGFYCIKQERKFSRFDRFLKHMAEKEKFKKLILRKIGCATQGGFSLLAGQSMGILYEINEKNIP